MKEELGRFVDSGNLWKHPHTAVNVLCYDGKRRTVRLNREPDGAFSWSGRASFQGKTVKGFVTSYSLYGERDDLFFVRDMTEDWRLIPK